MLHCINTSKICLMAAALVKWNILPSSAVNENS
jgi:hypothetical protein